MAWWWYLRSGRVSTSSALCPLPRPPPWLIISCSSRKQSSEGRGTFCYCSDQANLRQSPLVGRSLSWSLFFKSFNWGHWEFIVGLDLIFGMQNSLLGPFSGLVGVACVNQCCPSSHNLTFISIVLRETWQNVRVHTQTWVLLVTIN